MENFEPCTFYLGTIAVNNVINFDPPEKKLHITELLISYVIDRMSIFTTMVSYD